MVYGYFSFKYDNGRSLMGDKPLGERSYDVLWGSVIDILADALDMVVRRGETEPLAIKAAINSGRESTYVRVQSCMRVDGVVSHQKRTSQCGFLEVSKEECPTYHSKFIDDRNKTFDAMYAAIHRDGIGEATAFITSGRQLRTFRMVHGGEDFAAVEAIADVELPRYFEAHKVHNVVTAVLQGLKVCHRNKV
ncbi:hypothetical protein FPQ18DRAFT_327874 [Pyronema domesticum]|nr:hypothetical protein FPQ18DRAFT_327874 [Pyronema domesticum]